MNNREARICILTDRPRMSAHAEGTVLFGWEQSFVEEKLLRAGINPSDIMLLSISTTSQRPTHMDWEECLANLNSLPNLTVIVALDEVPLNYTTDKRGIRKWQLSPLDATSKLKCRKVIPSFHPEQVRAEWELGLYFEKALIRARKESSDRNYLRKPHLFHLNPDLPTTIEILNEVLRAPQIAVDIETGRGIINTVGFAWSPSNAIAVNVLPDRMGTASFHSLWKLIAQVLDSPAEKFMQNGIFETMYFAKYGMRIRNFRHDTMVANKFLWPEFDKNLGNVGRLYTNEPYWKDTGKVEAEEGKRKDWGAVRDWLRHYEYNCLDSAGTFEAALNQRADLKERGLWQLYSSYIAEMHKCVAEMCLRGLPLNHTKQAELITTYEARVAELTKQLSKEINPNSSIQKVRLFRDKGYKIPTKVNAKGERKDSCDELALKKIKLDHPDDTDIPKLLEIAEFSKALSSYLRVQTDPITGNIHFSIDPHGTETGRWSCNSDPWGRGFNAQTIPKYAKKMIEWSEESGRIFMQCDLKQAESRFVAYDSADYDLIQMLEDPTKDIHRYVAAEIFGKPESEITKDERQLGKKSGHGANYSMGVTTFQASCLKEMDLVLSLADAKKTLDAYHKLFPGIRRWHASIQQELRQYRRLSNPFGRTRYFYGRMDDNTFREAYAYKPQSTVPDIVNHLMLRLLEEREAGRLPPFWLHLQCHDSLTLSCTASDIAPIADFMLALDKWHPQVRLTAGMLRIPVSIETGRNLGGLSDYRG